MNLDKLEIDLIKDIRAHVKEQFPKEACGFIMPDGFVKIDNVHKKPESHFSVESGVFTQFASNCIAFVHSHPNWYPVPSEDDMRQQIATNIPWGIIATDGNAFSKLNFWGDMLDIPSFDYRPFVHGITDCYSTIRHWYKKEKNIWIKEFPRNWEWWEQDGVDLYKDNFKVAGFEVVSHEEIMDAGPQIGDVPLAILGRSKKINHGGIYTGEHKLMHHITSKNPYDMSRLLIKDDPVERYMKYISMWVRYKGLQNA